ncbi:uncharacterized protein LOC119976640 [Scyliorhinus canicula]|uniref:uncharacterized protein LOC119976640 n=1 Tax=Scyliorhinus canicula TaxID=7830 RepID=UPI0018F71AEB|nr:uncharacterized protein LOC119976640 [Scyliorhinus canicula]XP_038673223.1 uncharacterized protein LOC119976640 [Scyliorhinus canicula]
MLSVLSTPIFKEIILIQRKTVLLEIKWMVNVHGTSGEQPRWFVSQAFEISSNRGIAGGQKSADSQSDVEPLDSIMSQLLELQRQGRESKEGISSTLLRLQGSVRLQSEVIAPTCQHNKVNTGRVSATKTILVLHCCRSSAASLSHLLASNADLHLLASNADNTRKGKASRAHFSCPSLSRRQSGAPGTIGRRSSWRTPRGHLHS